ncbi:RNA dependent RNA polymerase-domain-containing protein, partial [Corynascus novoguineensis]
VQNFQTLLEPDEVHICLSKLFGVDRYSDLDGHVLVARNPAHLPSDIQRVKAVFKPGLRHLKDVIVFSIKGDVSLAHTLSGGDYDGDIAWVCWDSDTVGNFQNTETKPEDILPPEHVLSSLFDWNITTVGSLSRGAYT